MATTNLKRVSNQLAAAIAGASISFLFLATAALADTPNRADDVKQASQPIPGTATQPENQFEEIETLGPRNFGPVEPPAEVDFVPVALPSEQPAEELAVLYGRHYYGGYYGGYYGAYYRPYAYSYPYFSYYRPYYAYPYHYNYAGYYVPNYVSRYVGYYSPYPYVGYYSPSPYVGYGFSYGYRPIIVAPVVYGGCYYW